jgi:hypothetical protein
MTTYTTPHFATGLSERNVRPEPALNRARPAPAATYRTAGVTNEAALMADGQTPDWQPAAAKGVPKAAIGAVGAALVGGVALAIVLLAPSSKVTKQVLPDPIAQAPPTALPRQKSADSADAAVKRDWTIRRRPQAPAANRPTLRRPTERRSPRRRPGTGPGRDPGKRRRWSTPRSPACRKANLLRSSTPRDAGAGAGGHAGRCPTSRRHRQQTFSRQQCSRHLTRRQSLRRLRRPSRARIPRHRRRIRPGPVSPPPATPASALRAGAFSESHHDAALPLVARPALAGPCARQPGDDARPGRHRRLPAVQRACAWWMSPSPARLDPQRPDGPASGASLVPDRLVTDPRSAPVDASLVECPTAAEAIKPVDASVGGRARGLRPTPRPSASDTYRRFLSFQRPGACVD